MFLLLQKSLKDFRLSFAEYLSFELVYSFLTSVLIIPLLTFVFNKVFMQIGKGEALLNNDVYQLGFSFNGVTGMFAISLLVAAVLFVQFGTLIIIS